MSEHNLISAEQAKELLKDTTPGPWMVSEEDFGNTFEVLGQDRAGRFGFFPIIDTDDPSDAPLIATAPDLAHTVIAQAEQIKRLQMGIKEIEYWEGCNYKTTLIDSGIIAPQDMETPK